MVRVGFLFVIGILLAGCVPQELNYDSASLSSISGKVLGLEGTSSVSALSCTSPQARLYSLDSNGKRESEPIDTVDIENGRFKFSNLKQKGFDSLSDSVKYVIEVTGCDEVLTRPVTGKSDQDISRGSSLLEQVSNLNSGKDLSKVNKGDLQSLISQVNQISGSDTYVVFNNALATASVTNRFQEIFGVSFVSLLDAPPLIQTLSGAAVVNELSGANFSVVASHFDPSYQIKRIWKLNGVTVSSSANYTFTPSVNQQGMHAIQLFIGKDDGGGDLDLSKPYITKTFSLSVNNTYPAAVPDISLTSSSLTNDTTVNFTMDTGVAMGNCATFSKLAITEDNLLPPVSETAYTITCDQTISQNLTYTLTDAVTQGTRTLRLWAMDAAGNISVLPKSVALTFDNQPPVVSSVSINDGATYAGTAILTVKAGVSDNLTSHPQVRLKLANAGTLSCQSEYADDGWQSWTSATTNILFSIAPFDGTKKVCVWAKDAAGNISLMAPAAGAAGVNYDEIEFQTGNIPQLTKLEVKRTADNAVTGITTGQPLTITWSAQDIEGLDNNPIAIAYSTNNSTWLDIVTNQNITNPANITWLGGLSGNPTSVTDQVITTFNTPTITGTAAFRLKAKVRDGVGNQSVVVNSQLLNSGSWSVYAGTKDRGDGGSGRSAALYNQNSGYIFGINPKTGDIYASDGAVGIRKLDVKTGIVTTFIYHGTLNLPDNGPLPAVPAMSVGYVTNIVFDSNGFMYLGENLGNSVAVVYQIDLDNNWVRKYAGGGTAYDEGNTPTDVNVAIASYVFDDENSMYFHTWCNIPTTNNEDTTGKRILKLTQNADGTPGTISRIIGNCVDANPTSGATAYNAPAGNQRYPSLSSIVPINNGNVIYVAGHGDNLYKIINGTVYSVNTTINASWLSMRGMAFNKTDGKIYKTLSTGGLERFTINTIGDGGEVKDIWFTGDSSSVGCSRDGVDISSLCTTIDGKPVIANGTVYFTDGARNNNPSGYRIRFLDANDKIRTIFGSDSFYGDGLDRQLIRGRLSGIYYKNHSDHPGQTSNAQNNFPEGLYFTDSSAMIFGHVNPVSNLVSVLFGNQDNKSYYPPTGAAISTDLSMGQAYPGASGMSMTFDFMGLPWLKISQRELVKVDDEKKIVRLSEGSTGLMHSNGTVVETGDPYNYNLYVYTGFQNFTLKNQTLFYMGAYNNSAVDPTPKIIAADYAGRTITKIMGGNLPKSTPGNGISSDTAIPGSVADTQLFEQCVNDATCFVQYNSSNDRLYFVESNKIRYITTATNPATSTLGTLFTLGSGNIRNFSFNKDYSQLWYLATNGRLFCYDISSGKSWCDNTTNYHPNTTFTPVGNGPNQMTWKDNSTMFLSTYSGEILQFTVPAGP